MPTSASRQRPPGTAISGAKRRSSAPPALMTPACIRADTGVGDSIVSGSQLWKGNWADLVSAATAIRTATRSARPSPGDTRARKDVEVRGPPPGSDRYDRADQGEVAQSADQELFSRRRQGLVPVGVER